MNLVQIRDTGAFGIIVSKDFDEAALFAFKRKYSCECDDCKHESMSVSEEIQTFVESMVKRGKIGKSTFENGKVFELSFEEYCLYQTCSSDDNNLPLQIFLCLLYPNRMDFLDYCLFSDNAKNFLFKQVVMHNDEDEIKDMTVDEMIEILFPNDILKNRGN